jgi:hypothetical protein
VLSSLIFTVVGLAITIPKITEAGLVPAIGRKLSDFEPKSSVLLD